MTDPSGTTGDRAESSPPVASRQQVRERCFAASSRKGPRSGWRVDAECPRCRRCTSPLAACCATNVPRDVRPAGALPPRQRRLREGRSRFGRNLIPGRFTMSRPVEDCEGACWGSQSGAASCWVGAGFHSTVLPIRAAGAVRLAAIARMTVSRASRVSASATSPCQRHHAVGSDGDIAGPLSAFRGQQGW